MLEKLLQGTQSPTVERACALRPGAERSSRAVRSSPVIASGGSPIRTCSGRRIQYLGMNGTAANRQVLSDDLRLVDGHRHQAADPSLLHDVRRQASACWRRRRAEKSPELRSEAVRQLGMMGAREELWQLYQKESSVEVRQQMLQGMMMGGDIAHLAEVANADANMDLRRQAVRLLGMAGGGGRRVRRSSTSTHADRSQHQECRGRRALHPGNAESLVALAKKETDPAIKRRIVEKLSIMGSPAATEYLLDLPEVRRCPMKILRHAILVLLIVA